MGHSITLQVSHTSQLSAELLRRVRVLLDLAFEGDFAEDDWHHTIGGLHILAWMGTELVGHSSVIQRQLLHKGRALRAGYLEAMAVHPEHQRKGVGALIMIEVEGVIRSSYELGMLGASDEGLRLYQKCGWLPWRGRAMAFTPGGIIHTHEEECLYVLEVSAPIDREADITCEYREGDLW
jgi:aminoglycoside 2'-N-acetyltransferase I